MKKIIIIFLTCCFVITLVACDSRISLSDKRTEELFDETKKILQEEDVWSENYIICVDQSLLVYKNEQITTYIDPQSKLNEEQLKSIFLEYKKYFNEGLSSLNADNFSLTGYRVSAANGIEKLCFVKLESDWYFNEKIVPITSFDVMLYENDGVGLEIDCTDDVLYPVLSIYLNVSEQEEANIIAQNTVDASPS
ncbi:MAG: hypothetical protein J6A83_06405 [Clostridia bacterium]|nr:hypothetical protein [Clostridia bacterium]